MTELNKVDGRMRHDSYGGIGTVVGTFKILNNGFVKIDRVDESTSLSEGTLIPRGRVDKIETDVDPSYRDNEPDN